MHHSPHCTPEKVQPPPSVFRETPLTPEQIANNLRDEIKRLKRRKQFAGAGPSSPGSPPSPVSAPSSPEPMMDLDHGAMMAAASSSGSTKADNKPIFTLKQMIMIADRMCAERVEQVRAEYDNILQQKLSEQYDAFVKFIDHQIQKRFDESQAPSYLS